jgi:hypothetical protein
MGVSIYDGKGLIAVDRSERDGCVHGRARSPHWVVTLLLLHLLHSFASWTILANPVCQTPLPYYFSCAFCHTLAPYYSCNPLSAFWRCRSLAVFCTIVPYSFAFSCHALLHSFAKLFCSFLPGSLARLFCCRPLQYSFAAVLRSLSSLLQSFAHFCHTLCHTLCRTLCHTAAFL